jgi:hypothetical protein
MADHATQPSIVWLTKTFAVNPANVLAVFHGHGGNIEVYMHGFHQHFSAADLTDAGRALLTPPADVLARRSAESTAVA